VARGALTISLPHDAAGWRVLVALIGATFSPYFFIWQAAQEVEEKRGTRGPGAQLHGTRSEDVKARKLDVGIGTFFSRAVMFFVMLTTSLALHGRGSAITTTADAAEALRPIAGPFAASLFAMGLLGVGFLVIPVLSTSAAYAFAELFDWRHGLDQRPGRARGFYAVILLATAGGVAIQFASVSAFQALFWSGVLNGALAPFLLLAVLLSARRLSPPLERLAVAAAVAGSGLAFFFLYRL